MQYTSCYGKIRLLDFLEVFSLHALVIALGIIYLIICVILTIVVMLQESKQQGMTGVTGGQTTYFDKNKGGMKKEAFLSRLTISLSVFFAVIAIVLSALIRAL